MPSTTTRDQVQKADKFTEELTAQWHPATLSDRKLLKLRKRLVTVNRLGGAFACVDFSPQARERLTNILQDT